MKFKLEPNEKMERSIDRINQAANWLLWAIVLLGASLAFSMVMVVSHAH